MSSNLKHYLVPLQIHSSLLKAQPDAVPPTEELDALQNELKSAKAKTLERARKAGDDLRTIEESMRKLKEREKGKAKAIDKVKKERGCTCHSQLSMDSNFDLWNTSCCCISLRVILRVPAHPYIRIPICHNRLEPRPTSSNHGTAHQTVNFRLPYYLSTSTPLFVVRVATYSHAASQWRRQETICATTDDTKVPITLYTR